MEYQNSEEELQDAVAAGKPVIIKTCKMNRETEEYILYVLEVFLCHIGKQKIQDQLSYCIRELLNNAKKANMKRAFFKAEKLDILKPDDYSTGMQLFKEKTVNNAEYYLDLQKQMNMYVQAYFKIKNSFLFIVISNNSPLLPVEKERIAFKIKKAKTFRSVEEAFQTFMDDSEGAGLGILILILMFRKIGLSEKHIEFISDGDLTHVKIDLPLSLITREDGEKLSEEVVKEIDSIPPIPDYVRKIMCMVEDETLNLKDLNEVIGKDPRLTIDILKMVNSASYRRINKIERIDVAISIVGLKGIKLLIQSYGVLIALEDKYDKKIQEKIWNHCHRVGNMAARLCKIFNLQDLESQAYICGLLHDIGKIVVLSLHQDTILKVQEYCEKNGWEKNTLDCLLSETNSFLIGKKMAEKWDLSPELSYVISHQIEPFNSDEDKIMLVKIVYLANVIDNILTEGDEDLEYKDSILEDFGINNSNDFVDIVSKLRNNL